jgi:hypothetical protein
MAYTPSGLKVQHNFGGLVNDGNRNAMTGVVGSTFQTQDATGTPVTSPATVNTTQTLVVPQNAVSVLIASVTNAVQVSEDSTQSAFFTLPAGNPQWFDCARQQNIYLKTGGSTVVSFMFKLV